MQSLSVVGPASNRMCNRIQRVCFVAAHEVPCIAEQLATAGIPHVDCVLSTAKSADNINWIANVLRPFGHLCVVDGGPPIDVRPLMPKAASFHTEMVFSRIIYGREPERQARILATVASLVVEGRVKSIATTPLEGLTAETMKAAHELVKSGRTVGKVVIAI